MIGYEAFLAQKAQLDGDHGFASTFMPDALFPFQAALTEWAIRKGRAALMEDCGLGKTLQELVWAENVARHTGKPVLLLTPLAVAPQVVREAEKFGIEAVRSPRGELPARIVVTNYERLHHFRPEDFGGVVCDESSILKNFDGKTKAAVTEFMRTLPFRLLATATAAPNDYTELGTSSEALGHLGHMDMLSRFFINEQRTSKPLTFRNRGDNHAAARERDGWRFKGHSEQPFWRWVSSWARALRRPSDLGFADDGFVLPELIRREHVIEAREGRSDMLFDVPARGLREEREERRRTIAERCEQAASLVSGTGQPAVVWCHLNDEGDMLETLIPGAVQVSGRDSDEAKEEKLTAFAASEIRVLVTKPKIASFGLNWQHCNHAVTFASHSFEQDYQSVRRFWRFGQTRPVTIDLVATAGEANILGNLARKAEQAETMFASLVEHMRDGMVIRRDRPFDRSMEVPAWLAS